MKRFRYISLLFPVIAVACQDSHDGPTLAIYSNVVTFETNTPSGARFTYRAVDDSPEVTLGTSGKLDEAKVAPGTRLLMTYSLPSDASYGEDCLEVQLRGLQFIYTDTVRPVPSPTLSDMMPVKLLTLYRTGHYLNFTAMMPAVDHRKYFMVADQATLSRDTVEVYMSTRVADDQPVFDAMQTGSIDISPVWDIPTLSVLRVNVRNANNPERSRFTFIKNPNL